MARLLTVLGLLFTIPACAADDRPQLGDIFVAPLYSSVLPSGKKAGVLITQEALSLHQSLSSAKQNIRRLYTSTNELGNNEPSKPFMPAVSGALFLPASTPPKNGWPLL